METLGNAEPARPGLELGPRRPVADEDQLDPVALGLLGNEPGERVEQDLQSLAAREAASPRQPQSPRDRRPRIPASVPNLLGFNEARDDPPPADDVPADRDAKSAPGDPPGGVVPQPDGLRRAPEPASARDGERAPGHVAEPPDAGTPGQPGGKRRVRRRNLQPHQVGAID